MRYAWALLAALLATPALGQEYSQSCNRNGYVIQAEGGVFAGAPIYLGKSCDAFHADHGDGTWCWHNGGVNLYFESGDWILSRVELYCQTPGLSGVECGCNEL